MSYARVANAVLHCQTKTQFASIAFQVTASRKRTGCNKKFQANLTTYCFESNDVPKSSN
jgi:hypothetical protein